MKVLYCDICEQVIKPGDSKTIVAFTDTIHGEENQVKHYSSLQTYIDSVTSYDNVDVREICPNCKEILSDLYNKRLNGLQYIKDKIDKVLGLDTLDDKEKKIIKHKKRKKGKKDDKKK